MTTNHTDDLWKLASAKSAQIAANLPELEPALALQMGMLRLLIDAAGRLKDSGESVPSQLTPDLICAKWARGVPAFRNESVAFPSPLKELLPRLCDVLVNGGAGDSAVHLRDALTKGDIDAESLLRVSFARNQKAIRTSSIHMGLAPDLVWLVGELGSSPLAHHLQSNLLTSPELQEGVHDWDRGYCPCCGSWPALIEVLNGPGRRSPTREGGGRMLRCSFCAASWELKAYRCVYCGNAGDRFVAAAPDMTRRNRLVELCGECGNYTKAIEVDSLMPFPLIAIEDLASLDLDQGAMEREYHRPSLFDLDAIEPPASPGCS